MSAPLLSAELRRAGYVPAMTVGRYLLLEQLGSGGMGVVFRAHDLGGYRDVALKLLPPERVADPLRRSLLEREARAAAAVAHPNVTAVLDFAPHADVPYLAMELARGSNLREHLRRGLTQAQALHIAHQIALGLAAAHAAGVVHRDLKPENVMVDGDGAVKVLDFGLATLHEPSASSPLAPHSWGTRLYMAPEQLAGRTIDARADVYAFGVVLHELLTGEAPVEPGCVKTTACGGPAGTGPWRRREKARQLNATQRAALLERLARSGAAELVHGCLNPDPSLRPASGAVLERLLRSLFPSLGPGSARRHLGAQALGSVGGPLSPSAP